MPRTATPITQAEIDKLSVPLWADPYRMGLGPLGGNHIGLSKETRNTIDTSQSNLHRYLMGTWRTAWRTSCEYLNRSATPLNTFEGYLREISWSDPDSLQVVLEHCKTITEDPEVLGFFYTDERNMIEGMIGHFENSVGNARSVATGLKAPRYDRRVLIHLLYYMMVASKLLVPIGKPPRGYVVRLSGDWQLSVSKLFAKIVEMSGPEALVPFFHWLDYEAEFGMAQVERAAQAESIGLNAQREADKLRMEMKEMADALNSRTSPFGWVV